MSGLQVPSPESTSEYCVKRLRRSSPSSDLSSWEPGWETEPADAASVTAARRAPLPRHRVWWAQSPGQITQPFLRTTVEASDSTANRRGFYFFIFFFMLCLRMITLRIEASPGWHHCYGKPSLEQWQEAQLSRLTVTQRIHSGPICKSVWCIYNCMNGLTKRLDVNQKTHITIFKKLLYSGILNIL